MTKLNERCRPGFSALNLNTNTDKTGAGTI
jgi:hypothetical protein